MGTRCNAIEPHTTTPEKKYFQSAFSSSLSLTHSFFDFLGTNQYVIKLNSKNDFISKWMV